jgi:hypothetical protein
MKPTAVLKRAPTLFVFASLSWGCYSLHASLPDSSNGPDELAKGAELMMKDLFHASASEVRTMSGAVRDPFRIILKNVGWPKSKTAEAADDAESEFLGRFVQDLRLDATFLQGRSKIAIINGQIYHQGQHLQAVDDKGNAHASLLLQEVEPHLVTLSARGKFYVLGYPSPLGRSAKEKGSSRPADGALSEIDPEGQLAFYKRLINSPFGKLGKSVIGKMGTGQAGASPGSAPPRGRPGAIVGYSQ